MIFRRIKAHIEKENWFAVFIDFAIVVFGVFIGIQVANWNEARQQNARGVDYAERLETELRAEYEYGMALLSYYETTRKAGIATYAGLSQPNTMDDATILINAFRASQYNWYERRRATFDEIIGSGSMALIKDANLRETAIGVYNSPLFALMQVEGQDSRYRELFRMTVEPSIYDEILQKCGDKEYDPGGVAVGLITIDYACTIDVSADDMRAAVTALRGVPGILEALRLRNAEVYGRTMDMDITFRVLGLTSLYQGETAP